MGFKGGIWGVARKGVMQLYCWLRILLYWLGKTTVWAVLRFRCWLLKGKRDKLEGLLGRTVYALHRNGVTDWADNDEVKERLHTLESNDRKRRQLETRLKDREKRYQERVRRLRGLSPPPQPAGTRTADAARVDSEEGAQGGP
ncbi:MAG: hypothetical protein ACLFVT_04130 [Syntrophobacteria bacterium]